MASTSNRRDIRLATPQDAPGILAVYAPIVATTAISFELEVPTVAEMVSRIQRVLRAHPWIVLTEGSEFLGYAYAQPWQSRAAYRWVAETSVYVDAGARRRGVGRSLYAGLLSLLELQGYRQAVAGIALPNPASEALHRAAGFAPAGTTINVGWKLERWHDVAWYQRPLNVGAEPPAEPRALDQLLEGEISAALEEGGAG